MSNDLSEKKCIPCEGGIPPFSTEKIQDFLKKIDGWSAKEDRAYLNSIYLKSSNLKILFKAKNL